MSDEKSNQETGMMANLDRAEKRKKMFYDIDKPAYYEIADEKLDHYDGLVTSYPESDLSLTNALRKARLMS